MSFGLAGREAVIVRVKVNHDTVYGYRRWGEYAPDSSIRLMRRSIWEHFIGRIIK